MADTFLYKQSIYFEIYEVNSLGGAGQLLESFAFTMPPSSVTVSTKERVTVTPTPAGNFIDRYGLGNAEISVDGDTGNGDFRFTVLGPGRAPRSFDGRGAWFEFRDRIARYSLKKENYIMYFYDLTHQKDLGVFTATGSTARYSEAWEVVLKDTASLRSNQKPFFYPYKLQMEGVRPLGTYQPRFSLSEISAISAIRASIDGAFATLSNLTAQIDSFVADSLEFASEVTGILTSITAFSSALTEFSDQIIEYEQKLSGIFEDVLSESEDIINAGIQLIEFPYNALETAKDEIDSLSDQVEALVVNARDAGKDALDLYDWEETVDPVSELEQTSTDLNKSFNEIVKTSKQDASDEPISSVAIEGVPTSIYGFNTFSVKENTRLDKIARDFYGNADVKDIISGLNNIYSNDELTVGSIILLPVLEPQARFTNNAVYNNQEERGDIYGRDIKLEDGVIQTTSTDYLLTSGEETVSQALNNRILEKKNRQIRDESYGIVTEVGEALDVSSSFELLSVSLRETLSQDPRVIDVYDLNYEVDGDKIYQSFKYDTITRDTVDVRGAL